MGCKFLIDKNGKFICKLTKQPCPYVRYCTQGACYVFDKLQKCPAFKKEK